MKSLLLFQLSFYQTHNLEIVKAALIKSSLPLFTEVSIAFVKYLKHANAQFFLIFMRVINFSNYQERNFIIVQFLFFHALKLFTTIANQHFAT